MFIVCYTDNFLNWNKYILFELKWLRTNIILYSECWFLQSPIRKAIVLLLHSEISESIKITDMIQ